MGARVQSFTEKALLNRWALDFFCPTTFQPIRLQSINNSVSDSFFQAKIDPFSSPEKQRGTFSTVRFGITTTLRVAYVGLTVLSISWLGAFYNGLMTGVSLGKYAFTTQNRDENFETFSKYGHAFLRDLFCAVIGSTFLLVTFGALLQTRESFSRSEKIQYSLFATIAATAEVAFLILLQTPYGAAQCLTRTEERCGMYLSFSLRNKLGIVGEDGGLLPFSKGDQFYKDTGKNYQSTDHFTHLIEMIVLAEFKLVELVSKVNENVSNAQKIPFSYPFNGAQIAKRIHEISSPSSSQNSLAVQSPLPDFERQLLAMGQKIDILFNLYVTVQDLSINYSWAGEFLRTLCQMSTKRIPIKKPSSLFKDADYGELFRVFSTSGVANDLSDQDYIYWGTGAIQGISSRTKCPQNNTYLELKHNIGILKYLNPEKISYIEICNVLGINKDISWQVYKSLQRKYLLATHPDKHRGKEQEAEAYFKVIKEAFDKWESKKS